MYPISLDKHHKRSVVATLSIAAAAVLGGRLNAQSTVVWSECPDRNAGGVATECTVLEMPLDHSRADGPTMEIGVRRVLGTRSEGRQLWYLAGGPGDAVGGALGGLAGLLNDPGLDLYGIDHRGTGASGVLECPDQQAVESEDGSEIVDGEWRDCIEHLRRARDDLSALTVTQSAMDLGRIIDILRPEGGSVFVLGVSFGSFWANRYLQLFSDQPTGVILDGIVPADWSFAEFDASLDAAGRRWLVICTTDTECRARLGDDPAASLATTLAKLDDGHCPTVGLDAATARLISGVILMVDGLPNALIPALSYRLDRCAWQDEMAILHFFRHALSGIGESDSHSPTLQRHVALSELWDESDPDPTALESAIARTVMTTDVSASFAKTFASWPRYPADSLDGRQAEYQGPLLMLHGDADPTMPVARLEGIRSHFVGNDQTFVVIPEAGHVVLNFSECALGMYSAFLADPDRRLDASCVGTETLTHFGVGPQQTEALLGDVDLWGDDTSLGETIWFKLRYRWAVLLLGLAVPLLWLRRTMGQSAGTTQESGASLWLPGARLLFWGLVTLGSYALTASIPLLTDYRAWIATLGTVAVLLAQATIGGVLMRRRRLSTRTTG